MYINVIWRVSLILLVIILFVLFNINVSIGSSSSNENNNVSSRISNFDKAKSIQLKLKYYGFYKGAIDGILGDESIKALSDYRVSISEDKYVNGDNKSKVASGKNTNYLSIDTILKEVESRPDLSPYLLHSEYPSDIASIKQHGELIVGMLNSNRIPFFSGVRDPVTNLSNSGIDVDLVRDIAKGLNVHIRVDSSATTFDELVELLSGKKVDMVVSKLSITKERIPSVMFTNPYTVLRRAVITKREELPRNISVMNDVEISKVLYKYSGKVGVIKGSAYINYIREDLPNAHVIELDTWNDVVRALTSQQINMVYRDEVEMLVLLNNFPGLKDEYVVYSIRDKVDSIGIGLPNNSFGLLSYLNSFLVTRGKLTNQRLLNRVSTELNKSREIKSNKDSEQDKNRVMKHLLTK